MNYKIVTDSSSNIFSFDGIAHESVPLKIITSQAEYVDTAALDVEAMVNEIKVTKGRSGTSCPNAADWMNAFEGADRVFAITITSNLSGSYNTAAQAAEEYVQLHPDAKVRVIDTLSTGPEMRLMAEFIRNCVARGLEFEAICDEADAYLKHTHLLFSLESLTNLARNGRTSPAVAKIAGVLGIRLVGAASDVGTLEPLHKSRGEDKAIKTLYAEMKSRGFEGGKLRIAHCFNLGAAEKLSSLAKAEYPGCDVEIEPCGALCSFYAERGGMLVGFEDAIKD